MDDCFVFSQNGKEHFKSFARTSHSWPHGFTTCAGILPEVVTAYTKPYSMAGWPSAMVRGARILRWP